MPGQIAGYRLDRPIGRSDVTTVYLALDKRLDRQVAVKVIAPELAGQPAFWTRWLRESRTAAGLGHPHILPVYEAGEADGVLYMAMRYVQGGDIRSLLSQTGPLQPAAAWTILTQAASALDAAHARSLIHRDVKPANLLLEASHVYLADFGMGADTSGSFDYVAPEQIEGRALDGRADLYSLACVGFELLSGTPLFGHDQRLTVMYAQLYAPPPSARARRPDLPAAVDRVLATALAKNPAERYASCSQFAEELAVALGLSSRRSRPPDRAGPVPVAWAATPPSPFASPLSPLSPPASPSPSPPSWPASPSGPASRPGEGAQPMPGSARRAGADPRRPRRRPAVIKAILAAVAAVAVVAVAAVAAVAVVRGVAAPKAPAPGSPAASRSAVSQPATAVSPRAVSPSPSPSVLASSPLASGQAATVNHLLGSSAATRQALDGAINEVLNCTNLSSAASQIQNAVSQRGSEYRQVSTLPVAALPQGAAVKSDLMAALRASLDADQDYLTWAQQQLNLGCSQPEQSTAYGAANSADQAADAAKQTFVQVWNPVAVKYGVPQQSADSI
jgi:serine/threonine protein kinase